MGYKLVDARRQIMGRICSRIAKQALLGDSLVIVNAKDAVISGHTDSIILAWLDRQEKHTLSKPTRGPFWPHRPDTIMRRCLRSMLPKNDRGRSALKRIQVFISDVPNHLKSKYPIDGEFKIAKADGDKIKRDVMSLGELAVHIGWKHRKGEE